jgi:hypothetical protein
MARRNVHTIETLRMQRRLEVDYITTAKDHRSDEAKAYDVIGISGDHWQVHKHGCSATFSRNGQTLTADLVWAKTLDEIAPQVIDSELLDMGYDYSCVNFHNCTKKY